MRVRSVLHLVVPAALALGASACGGDDASDDDAVVAVVPTDQVTTDAPPTSSTAAPTTTAIATPTVEPLFDFAVDDSAEGWGVVNDTVMGGVSSGELAVVDGALVFTGELSLDNNGGFASVRSPLISPGEARAWTDRPGPRIVVQGDGRTWTVEVRTDEADGGWIAELPTTSDPVTDVTIPWSSFAPVTRFLDPRESATPLDPGRIVSIAFYLVDGIEAPFRLAIRSIA